MAAAGGGPGEGVRLADVLAAAVQGRAGVRPTGALGHRVPDGDEGHGPGDVLPQPRHLLAGQLVHPDDGVEDPVAVHGN